MHCLYMSSWCVSLIPEQGPRLCFRAGGMQDTRASQKHLSEQLESLEQNVVLKDILLIMNLNTL